MDQVIIFGPSKKKVIIFGPLKKIFGIPKKSNNIWLTHAQVNYNTTFPQIKKANYNTPALAYIFF